MRMKSAAAGERITSLFVQSEGENTFDKIRKDSTKFYTPHCITGRNPVNCEYGYNRDSTEAGEDKM